jgi:hypothetical protein
MSDSAFSAKIQEHIEHVAKVRADHLEMFAAAFIKRTGLDPTECELVEQQTESGITNWHFRKKEAGRGEAYLRELQSRTPLTAEEVKAIDAANRPRYGQSILKGAFDAWYNGEQIKEAMMQQFADYTPMTKSIVANCSIVDWCELHQVDHGHPVPPSDVLIGWNGSNAVESATWPPVRLVYPDGDFVFVTRVPGIEEEMTRRGLVKKPDETWCWPTIKMNYSGSRDFMTKRAGDMADCKSFSMIGGKMIEPDDSVQMTVSKDKFGYVMTYPDGQPISDPDELKRVNGWEKDANGSWHRKLICAGDEVAPGVVAMSVDEQEQAKALLGFEIPGLTSVERTAEGGIAFIREGQPLNKYVQMVVEPDDSVQRDCETDDAIPYEPVCTCTSMALLSGHEPGCPYAEGGK